MKQKMKQTFGDTSKLPQDKWSARARVEKLRESPEDTYVPPKRATKVKVK